VQMLKEAEKTGAQYGLIVRQRPSMQYKTELAQYIDTALAASRDGGNSLELPDAMLIKEKMWRGENLTSIRQEVAYHIKKSKAEYEQKQQALVAQQGQMNQQAEQIKAEAAQQSLQMDVQKETMLKQADLLSARLTSNNAFVNIIMTKEGNGAERLQLQKALEMSVQYGGLEGVDLAVLFAQVGSMMASTPPPQPVGQAVGQ
jgi:hypothetical protein